MLVKELPCSNGWEVSSHRWKEQSCNADIAGVINVGHRRIAILYGGAHMPDLDRRLRKELKMVPKRSKWLTAWSIKKRGLETQSRPLRKTSAKSTGQLLVRFEAIELFVFFSFIALGLCSLVLFFRTVVNWALWAASIARQFVVVGALPPYSCELWLLIEWT